MNAVLLELRSDHHRVMKVLKLMRLAAADVSQALSPQPLATLSECVGYIDAFYHRIHHPREEAVFEILKRRVPSSSRPVDALQSEHLEMRRELIALESILGEHAGLDNAALPVHAISEKVEEFIEFKIQHMRNEEGNIFPLIEQKFQITDWKDLIRQQFLEASPKLSDLPRIHSPLFSETPSGLAGHK